jgi:hypothetical protein
MQSNYAELDNQQLQKEQKKIIIKSWEVNVYLVLIVELAATSVGI